MANGKLAPGIAAFALLALVWAGHGAAETSSWVGRGDGPAEPVPKKKEKDKAQPKQAPVKIIKTVPSASPTLPAVAPPIMPSFKGVPAGPVEPARPPVVAVPGPPASAPPDASDALRGTAAPAPINASEYAKTLPPSEDAAYEAFDQGRYLTALQLAAAGRRSAATRRRTRSWGASTRKGYGAPKNPGLAAQWYARGAELGDPEAMFALGVMLAEGQGVVKDREAAGQMFEAAALPQASARQLQPGAAVPEGRRQAGEPAPRASRTCCLRPRPAWRPRNTISARSTAPAPASSPTPSRPPSGRARPRLPACRRRSSTMRSCCSRAAACRPTRSAVPSCSARPPSGACRWRRTGWRAATLHGAGVEMNVVEAAKWHLIASAGGVADESPRQARGQALQGRPRPRAEGRGRLAREQQMGIE